MPNKNKQVNSKRRSWIKWEMNVPTIVLVLLALLGFAETRGVIKTELKTKVNHYQVETIIENLVPKIAYPLIDGIKLQSEYGFIKDQLELMQEELKEINRGVKEIATNKELKQRARTTANKIYNTPNLAIMPLDGSGDENLPIKELERFRLTK